MKNSRSSQQHHLGVNKLGKSIRKSPLHQPSPCHQPPQVYNISKNDFRSIVQQLTGTPSSPAEPHHPPPLHQPRHPLPPPPPSSSMRLHKIRPPPLTPIARPPLSPAPAPARLGWAAGSPVSAYMRYLETSLLHSDVAHPPGPLPSPSSFLNILSAGQQGILGPGLAPPMPPLSPGLFFPSPPSGFFPLLSPRWRDM